MNSAMNSDMNHVGTTEDQQQRSGTSISSEIPLDQDGTKNRNTPLPLTPDKKESSILLINDRVEESQQRPSLEEEQVFEKFLKKSVLEKQLQRTLDESSDDNHQFTRLNSKKDFLNHSAATVADQEEEDKEIDVCTIKNDDVILKSAEKRIADLFSKVLGPKKTIDEKQQYEINREISLNKACTNRTNNSSLNENIRDSNTFNGCYRPQIDNQSFRRESLIETILQKTDSARLFQKNLNNQQYRYFLPQQNLLEPVPTTAVNQDSQNERINYSYGCITNEKDHLSSMLFDKRRELSKSYTTSKSSMEFSDIAQDLLLMNFNIKDILTRHYALFKRRPTPENQNLLNQIKVFSTKLSSKLKKEIPFHFERFVENKYSQDRIQTLQALNVNPEKYPVSKNFSANFCKFKTVDKEARPEKLNDIPFSNSGFFKEIARSFNIEDDHDSAKGSKHFINTTGDKLMHSLETDTFKNKSNSLSCLSNAAFTKKSEQTKSTLSNTSNQNQKNKDIYEQKESSSYEIQEKHPERIIKNKIYENFQMKNTPDSWDDILSDLHYKSSVDDNSTQYASTIIHSPYKSKVPVKHHNHEKLFRQAITPYPPHFQGSTKFPKSITKDNFTDWQKNRLLSQDRDNYNSSSFLQSGYRNQLQKNFQKNIGDSTSAEMQTPSPVSYTSIVKHESFPQKSMQNETNDCVVKQSQNASTIEVQDSLSFGSVSNQHSKQISCDKVPSRHNHAFRLVDQEKNQTSLRQHLQNTNHNFTTGFVNHKRPAVFYDNLKLMQMNAQKQQKMHSQIVHPASTGVRYQMPINYQQVRRNPYQEPLNYSSTSINRMPAVNNSYQYHKLGNNSQQQEDQNLGPQPTNTGFTCHWRPFLPPRQ